MFLQPFGGNDSDVGSPNSNHAKSEKANLNVDPDAQLSEDQNKQKKGNESSIDEKDASNVLPASESYRSMGEILASMDPGNHLPVTGIEPGAGKQTVKASGTNFSSKRSTFWGRNNVRYFLLLLSLNVFHNFKWGMMLKDFRERYKEGGGIDSITKITYTKLSISNHKFVM